MLYKLLPGREYLESILNYLPFDRQDEFRDYINAIALVRAVLQTDEGEVNND
jgi:hypothetical protein